MKSSWWFVTSMITNNEMGRNRRKEKWGENFKVCITRTDFLMWTFAADLCMFMYLFVYTQLRCKLCLCIINITQKTIFLPMNSAEKILKMADREDWTTFPQTCCPVLSIWWGASNAMTAQCQDGASGPRPPSGNLGQEMCLLCPLVPTKPVTVWGSMRAGVHPPSRTPTRLRAKLESYSSLRPPPSQWLSK